MREKEQLLELRRQVAKKSGQATYLVPNDKEIEMILKVRPKSMEELTSIKGFPKTGKRVAAYGQAIIDIFTKGVSSINVTGSGEDLVTKTTLKSSSIFS